MTAMKGQRESHRPTDALKTRAHGSTARRGILGLCGMLGQLAIMVAMSVGYQPSALAYVTYTNNILNANCADPGVAWDGAQYVMSCTDDGTGGGFFPEYTSSDLVNWTFAGKLLNGTPSWATDRFYWAPEIHRVGGTWLFYFTAWCISANRLCLGVAPSTNGTAAGPYSASGAVILVASSYPYMNIDPTEFEGTDGTPYLAWKRYDPVNCNAINCTVPNQILVRQLASNGMGFAANSSETEAIQNDSGTSTWEWGLHYGPTVEGPYIVYNNGYYYLFYSGSDYDGAPSGKPYAMGVARSTTPTGTYTKYGSNPILKTPPGSNPPFWGPGHATILTARSGETIAVYHAWKPSASYRMPMVDRIDWGTDGWPTMSNAPTSTPQPGFEPLRCESEYSSCATRHQSSANNTIVISDSAASGGYKVGNIDTINDWVDYTFSPKVAGWYTVRVHYSAGGDDTTLKVTVNGDNIRYVQTKSTGGWSTFFDATTLAYFAVEVNSVRVQYLRGWSAQQDYVEVTPTDLFIPYESESATLHGPNIIIFYNSNYSGGAKVGNLNSSDDYVEYTVTPVVSGPHCIHLVYVAGAGDALAALSAIVDGVSSGESFTLLPYTGDWDSSMAPADFTVNLRAGVTNTVRIGYPGSGRGYYSAHQDVIYLIH